MTLLSECKMKLSYLCVPTMFDCRNQMTNKLQNNICMYYNKYGRSL